MTSVDPIAEALAPSGSGPSGPGIGGRTTRGVRSAALSVAITASSFAIAVGIWALVALSINDPNTLPTPGSVASRFIDLLSSGPNGVTLIDNIKTSLVRILIGWGIGVVGGVALGTAMGLSRWLRTPLEPIIEVVRPIPPLALIPLLIIWFGIGETPKIIILAFGTMPVVLIATVSALAGVEQNWDRAAQTLGATRWQRIRWITFPAALPEILVAIRIAQGLAWGSLIAAEIIASTAGLGFMILQAGRFLDTPTIFVGILSIGVLAYLMDRLLRVAEHILVPWKGRGNS